MPETSDNRRGPFWASRLLLAWQAWLFVVAVGVGGFIYVLYPESSITRDFSPAENYRYGRAMALKAFLSDDITPERLGLLLGAKAYLSVLEQSFDAAAGMNDLPLLLGRVYYALGEVAQRRPEMVRRERLLDADTSFGRAARLLSDAASYYPASLTAGINARRFQGKTLLKLGQYSVAAAVFSEVVDVVRKDAYKKRFAERADGFVLSEDEIGGAVEDIISSYVNALWLSGQRGEALGVAEEMLPAVKLPSYRAGLITVQGRSHLTDGPEFWETGRGKRLEKELFAPTTPEMLRLGALLALKRERPEKALSLLAEGERPTLSRMEETVLKGLAAAFSGTSDKDVAALLKMSLVRITPMLDRARLVALAEAGLRDGNLDDVISYFAALAREHPAGKQEEYVVVVGNEQTLSIGERLAKGFLRSKRLGDAAGTYSLLSGVAGADSLRCLQQAAFLYEKVGEAGEKAMYKKAAGIIEKLLSQGPPAAMVESLCWRAIEDWKKGGDGLRSLLLLEHVSKNLPNIHSMPKVLYELGHGYQEIGLFKKAMDIHTRNASTFPRSSYALLSLLDQARAAASLPDAAMARYHYLDILADGRLSPEAFPYMAALFEVGELEAGMIASEYRLGVPSDEEIHEAALRHIVEALERYTIDGYRQYPLFYNYLTGVEPQPAAEERPASMALARRRPLQVERVGSSGRPSAWLTLMRLHFMSGDYGEVLRVAGLAAPEIPSALKGDFLLVKGVAGVLAGHRAEPGDEEYAAAEEAFLTMRDMYIRRGETAWILLARAILEKSRGDTSDQSAGFIERAASAFSRLEGDQVEKYRFWQDVSNWLAAYQGNGGNN